MIIEGLKFNAYTFAKVARHFTHEESLISPSPAMNCPNWLVGHLLVTRKALANEFNIEFDLPTELQQRYGTGSKLEDQTQALPYDELVTRFDHSQELLEQAFTSMDLSDEQKARIGSYWLHESYHIGQIALLGRYLGKEGLR